LNLGEDTTEHSTADSHDQHQQVVFLVVTAEEHQKVSNFFVSKVENGLDPKNNKTNVKRYGSKSEIIKVDIDGVATSMETFVMEGFQSSPNAAGHFIPLVFRCCVLELKPGCFATVARIAGGKVSTATKYYAHVLSSGSSMTSLVALSNLYPPNQDGNFPALALMICPVTSVEYRRVKSIATPEDFRLRMLALNPDRCRQEITPLKQGRARKVREGEVTIGGAAGVGEDGEEEDTDETIKTLFKRKRTTKARAPSARKSSRNA
jgi:hypothetical protein